MAFLPAAFSNIINFQTNPNYLRLALDASENDFISRRSGNEIIIESFNSSLVDRVYNELKESRHREKYFKNIKRVTNQENMSTGIEIELMSGLDAFSFYSSTNNKKIIDFWGRPETTQISASGDKPSDDPAVRPPRPSTPSVRRSNRQVAQAEGAEVTTPGPSRASSQQSRTDKDYRDFRYGASFIWNYAPMLPSLNPLIDITQKTPEHFYPIKDRNFEENEMEAHLQLTINLYRRRNFGLMYKSIQMFEQKFGQSVAFEVIEYLKANALLRENIEKGERSPLKTAVAMLRTLADRTSNYEQKRGIYKFLLGDSISRNDWMTTLELSKRLYVFSRENYDYEESELAANIILHSLAVMGNIDELRELTSDRIIQSLIPQQVVLSYEMYALLTLGRESEIISLYEQQASVLTQPYASAILFNLAEAYFREANFDNSIKYFDLFNSHYSHLSKSSEANLRLALSFEILGRDPAQTIELYRRAINLSTLQHVRNEARIRLAAITNTRKVNPSPEDRELLVLLNFNNSRDGSDSTLSFDKQKALWLVRLRTLIVQEKFQEALSYLSAIPLNRLTPIERQVFLADGAEIIYGLIFNFYKKSDYAQVVKTWESYSTTYSNRVLKDPFMNYIVGNALIKLRLFNRFETLLTNFKKLENYPEHQFPLWVARENLAGHTDFYLELVILRDMALENYEAALSNITRLETLKKNSIAPLYRGLISYHQNDYPSTVKFVESYLTSHNTEFIHDPQDVAEMLLAYGTSLFKTITNDQSRRRFLQVISAILNDISKVKSTSDFLSNAIMKAKYMKIEVEYSLGQLEQQEVVSFIERFPSSTHRGRIQYLLGMSFVGKNNDQEGRRIFQELINDEKVSTHIKEMARSELALIEIRNRNL